MIEFTIEIYKIDRRRKSGKRFVESYEISTVDKEKAEEYAKLFVGKNDKLVYEIYETYRMVRNIMSGEMVKEHYKTPYSCSVGSESYFSM